MKKKLFIFIILCVILAAGVCAETTDYTEENTAGEAEENIAAQNFGSVAIVLIFVIGAMSVMMFITKINRNNLNKM